MELMTGETLADLVKRQAPLPAGQAVAYILDVIDGLLEAHRAGIIHRDVKPSNCFLTGEGRVKVGDFGLAKSLAPGARLTKTGAFLGTPLYASPEQIKGQAVDARTDVYSAAATLYYVLAGRAPFEGDDAMAVMAQAVSEPPPPLRGQRPDLPPGLERVVLRGLERDRDRRPQNLEELRADLLPFSARQSSAGTPGWRVAAHVLDGSLFVLLGTDFGLFELLARSGGEAGETVRRLALFLAWNGLWIMTFTLLEGLRGWSPGKLLLGLRVWSAADSEPPGLARALARTLVHFAIVYLAASVLQWKAYAEQDEWLGVVASVASVPGSLLLLTTMRARNGYRGPHELLSGTRVVRLPRSEAEDLLVGRPVGTLACTAAPPEALEHLGPFTVQGALRWTPSQKVLIGTDPALGRTVWIELHSTAAPATPDGILTQTQEETPGSARRDVHRPGRLRWLGGGVHDSWQWDAFLALPGVPATDLAAGGRRLEWHQARPVLEQLADELNAACADGTLPRTLTLEQVWVRPGGQVLLLDAPAAQAADSQTPAIVAQDQERSLALLRRIAVLLLDRGDRSSWAPLGPVRRAMLLAAALVFLGVGTVWFFEGYALAAVSFLLVGILSAFWLARALAAQAARDRTGFVRSPLPEHADALLARLLGVRRPHTTVAEVCADLESTRDLPARVTSRLRLAHLATVAALLSPGLFLMFFFARSFNGMAITVLQEEIAATEKALHVLDSGRLREFVHDHMGRHRTREVLTLEPPFVQRLDRDGIVERYSDPVVRRRLADSLQRQKEDLRQRLEAVNVIEWLVLGLDMRTAQQLLEPGRAVDITGFKQEDLMRAVHDAELKASQPALFRSYRALDPAGPELVVFALTFLAVCPLCCVVWAGLWRDGLTSRMLGLSLVLPNGRRAWRLQCAWRALVVWAPVTALLWLSLWLDAYQLEQTHWSWASCGGALVLLFGVAALALRSPDRGFHDRLAGTYVVPR
jgi:hypothetical protein